jgi:glucose-1-phosphate adenylyltransferase
MVSGGCVVSGAEVRGSLLFSRVTVNSFSRVADSVLLPDVNVGQRCQINRCIIDAGTTLEDGMVIGVDHDHDRERGFRVTKSGLTLVTPDMLGQQLHFTR